MNWLQQRKSIESDLRPASVKLDDRSTIDLLSFVAKYAGLIKYYDDQNRHSGDWRQFFLKAPQILLAAISKTNYQITLRRYNALLASSADRYEIDDSLSQLIFAVFIEINDWLFHMENDHRDYILKTYLFEQVSEKLSSQLANFIEIQKRLAVERSSLNSGKNSYEHYLKAVEDSFNHHWQISHPVSHTFDVNSAVTLEHIFKATYEVYVNIIDNAEEEYHSLKSEINNHPDTALLITFVRLMADHQEQFNQVTKKHLDFFYRKVLHQSERSAIADQAYLFLTLKEQVKQCMIEKGQLFDGGVDENGKPIIFTAIEPYELNQARVKATHRLSYKGVLGSKVLLKESYTDLGKIKRDTQGHTICYSMLNGKGFPLGAEVELGFIVYSRLLNLLSGERHVQVDFSFEDKGTAGLLANISCFVSTMKGWLEIAEFQSTQAGEDNDNFDWTIQFSIDRKSPEIVPLFTQGLEKTALPAIKFLLREKADLKVAPMFNRVAVGTRVEQTQEVVISNNLGQFNVVAPVQPFGPSVAEGADFVISNEALEGMPLTWLGIQFNWQEVPNDLADYYKQYNDFLNHYNESIEGGEQTERDKKTPYFSNETFKVSFALEAKNEWQQVNVIPVSGSGIMPVRNAESFAIIKLFNPETPTPDPTPDPTPSPTLNKWEIFLAWISRIFWKNPIGWWKKIIDRMSSGLKSLKLIDRISTVIIKLLVARFAFFLPNSVTQWLSNKLSEKVKEVQQEVHSHIEPVISEIKHDLLGGRIDDKIAVHQPKVIDKYNKISCFQIDLDQLTEHGELGKSQIDSIFRVRVKLENPPLAFGRSIYEKVVADVTQKNSIELLALAKTKDLKAGDSGQAVVSPLPNIPISPKLRSIVMSYEMREEYDFTQPQEKSCFDFKHINAFHHYSVFDNAGHFIKPLTRNQPEISAVPLFPSIAFSQSFFIGIDKLNVNTILRIYFKLIDQEPDLLASEHDEPLQFRCLTDNGWEPIRPYSDETDELNCSGVISFRLPPNMQPKSSLMPTNLHWISISTNSRRTINTTYINTQVVVAKRHLAIASEDGKIVELYKHLVPESITAMIKPVAGVDKIEQPFHSQHGRYVESESSFYARVSQRLSTKGRVVSESDFCTLAKNADEEIYYCKKVVSDTPTNVDLVVITTSSEIDLPKALRPKLNSVRLRKVQQYLEDRCSPLVKLRVSNPVFVEVQVIATIVCEESIANVLCLEVQNKLKLFLSPWITNSGIDAIDIDSGISESLIAKFIAAFDGVVAIESIKLHNVSIDQELSKVDDNALIVSAFNHNIQANTHCYAGGTLPMTEHGGEK